MGTFQNWGNLPVRHLVPPSPGVEVAVNGALGTCGSRKGRGHPASSLTALADWKSGTIGLWPEDDAGRPFTSPRRSVRADLRRQAPIEPEPALERSEGFTQPETEQKGKLFLHSHFDPFST